MVRRLWYHRHMPGHTSLYTLEQAAYYLRQLKKKSKFWKRRLKVKKFLRSVVSIRPFDTDGIALQAEGWTSQGIPTRRLEEITNFKSVVANYRLAGKIVSVVFRSPAKLKAKEFHIQELNGEPR